MASVAELKICIIGTGFSGLCAGSQLKEKLNPKHLSIFESNSEVGGTWLVNSYPGCTSDAPGHTYSFSFAPKSDWPKNYSSQPDVLEYLKDVASHYKLYDHIRFHTRVETLTWDESTHKWIASIYDVRRSLKETYEFDLVINGTGMLRIPHYPKELCNFTGRVIHTAEWDPSVDLRGKRVGVVGTGASGIQIVPEIVDEVEKLYVFQRSAPYIFPKPQFEYPEFAKWAFANIPGVRWMARATIYGLYELLYFGFKNKSVGAKFLEKISESFRRHQIRDESLREKMSPNYDVGCKRILPSNDYYPALQKPNCEVVTAKIVNVEGNVIKMDNGVEISLDILILATGYKPYEYFAPLKIFGKDGEDILDTWKTQRPKTYLGTVSSSLPNYFTILGPGTGLAQNSFVFMMECQTNWMLKVIEEMLKRNATYVNVKQKYESEYMEFFDNAHKSKVWGSDGCNSWYVNPMGRISTLWPLSTITFWKLTRTLDTKAFEFR